LKKMISKTKLSRRIGNKTNPEVVETLMLIKKNDVWNNISRYVSGPRRKYSSVSLKKIEEQSSEGDTIIIIGKVLGNGALTKKIRICAMGFSESAREKIKLSKSEAVSLSEELKKNKKAEGVKIIR